MDREFNTETNESSAETGANVDASPREPQPVDCVDDSAARESNDNGGINGVVRRRRRSLMERRNENSDNNLAELPRLSISSSTMSNGGALLNPEEAVDETVQVFENFVLMEIQEEHLDTPEGFPSRPPSTAAQQTGATGSSFDMQPHNYQIVAARLDTIARWLENRRRVRDEADMAHWGNITQEAFCAVLNHFIENGINLESIVQIFRFSRYIAIQYIKDNKKELFRKIMSWAIQFISQRISTWVREHGGWNQVLMTSYNLFCQYPVAVSIVVGVCCLMAGVILYRKYC